ncbi:MAG: DNA repair protein RecO [bacterium]
MVAQIALPIRDQAFLLRSVPYGDEHRILSFLTAQHGRVDAIALGARNSRKRFAGVLDFLHCLEIEFQVRPRGGLPQLLRCELREGFEGVRGDYDATMVALNWIRLLSRVLHEGQNVAGLFGLLRDGFHSLGQHRSDWVDAVFLRALLGRLGFFLELSRCLRCQNAVGRAFYFSPEAGGLLCDLCHPGPGLRPVARVIPARFWDTEATSGDGDLLLAVSRQVFAEGFRHYLGVELREKEFDGVRA